MKSERLIKQAYRQLEYTLLLQKDSQLRRDLQDLHLRNKSQSNSQAQLSESFFSYFHLADAILRINDHKLSIKQLQDKYITDSLNGLNSAQVKQRTKNKTFKKVIQVKLDSLLQKLLKNYINPMSLMLILSSGLYFASYALDNRKVQNFCIGIILSLILLLVPPFMFFFTQSFSQQPQLVKNHISEELITVIRNYGVRQKVKPSQIVVGDIIQVNQGQIVPADIRLIQPNNLVIRNSFLKGQSNIIRSVYEKGDNIMHSDNIALCSAVVIQGSSKGIVIASGNATLVAQLTTILNTSILLKHKVNVQGGIKYQLQQLMIRIAIFTFIVTGLFIFLSFGIGFRIVTIFQIAAGIILSNISVSFYLLQPISTILSYRKLATLKISTKSIQSLIKLGMTTCLCIGNTETMNRTKVSSFFLNSTIIDSRKLLDKNLNEENRIQMPELEGLYHCVMLSSKVSISRRQISQQTHNKPVYGQRYNAFLRKKQSNSIIKHYKLRKTMKSSQQLERVQRFIGKQSEQRISHKQVQNPSELNQDDSILNIVESIQQSGNIQLQQDNFVLKGDPFQAVILKYFSKVADFQTIKSQYPIVNDFTGRQLRIFIPSLKIEVSVHLYPTEDSLYCIFVKGSPQMVWNLCSHQYMNHQLTPLGLEQNLIFQKENQKLVQEGKKVIGFAKYHLPISSYPQDHRFSIEQIESELHQLVFMGMISLSSQMNHQLVEVAERCRAAGIRLLMLTDDDLNVVTQVARTNGVLTRPFTANQMSRQKSKSLQSAISSTNALILTDYILEGQQNPEIQINLSTYDEGTNLLRQVEINLKVQSQLQQKDDSKLSKIKDSKIKLQNNLEKCLRKKEVISACTNPYQQLLIIKALQQMNEVVTFVFSKDQQFLPMRNSDTVISKQGLDQMKQFTDLMLETDDITTILDAIQQGRKIFDNMKKCICFVLCSHIPQMMPFLAHVLFLSVLPIHGSLILYISGIHNIVLMISLLFQSSQLDVMICQPRAKHQKLFDLNMIYHSYGYMGWTQFFGALFTFLIIANDFGFNPSLLLFTRLPKLIIPNISDLYNPTSWNYGNSNLSTSCNNSLESIQLDYLTYAKVDLRQAALQCYISGGVTIYRQALNFSQCNVNQISPFTNRPVCYTLEAINYAQSGYFYSILICQIINLLACRTKKQPFYTQGLNKAVITSIGASFLLLLLIGFCMPLNTVLGTRDNIFIHYGTPAIPFAILQLALDQARKFLIRNLRVDEKGIHHWFIRSSF